MGSLLVAQGKKEASFQYLNKKDGLSQASVFAIAQDSTGFLWFGTRDGLNKYDGFRFEVYRHDGSPQAPVGSDVRTLYVDPVTKDLWVGTLSGLSRYDALHNKFVNYQHVSGSEYSLPGNVIRCVYRDQSGRLWVGTSRGLCRYDEKANAFYRHYPAGSTGEKPANDVTFVTENASGQLLLGTSDGLFRMEEGGRPRCVRVPAFETFALTSGSWDGAGNLWVGTYDAGVLRWPSGSGTVDRFLFEESNARSLSHNSVRTILPTPEGGLWVGTFDGLNFLEQGGNDFVRYEKNRSASGALIDNSIRSLLLDQAGSLWVGTYYGGIHHLDEGYNYFTNFRQEASGNSLNANVVSSFAEDSAGSLWIGTEGGGLNFYERSAGRFSRYGPAGGEPGAVCGNNVKQILLDGDDLWIGSFRAGLTRLNTQTGKFERYRHQEDEPGTIAHDHVYGLKLSDDLLWVLTYGGGLDIMQPQSGRVVRHYIHDAADSLTISSNLTRSVLKTRAGSWWIGTEKGLNRVLTDTEGFPEKFIHFLPDVKVYALSEDIDKNLWLGTFSNGLIRFDEDPDKVKRYTTADGLPDNTVFGILEADDGMLWLSTGNGLSRFDPVTETFTNYDYSNGLDNLEYNFNAYFRTREGAFLFGGINGFTRFLPGDLKPNKFTPPVVFTRLLRNGQEVEIGAPDGLLEKSLDETTELVFRYNEADFTLGFAALDYFSPENNNYAYKLEGLDRDWIYGNGVSEASYTIQREGEYVFMLRAGNSDGVWNDEVRRLRIRVLPPAWRSWWAYLMYGVFILLMVYALIHFLRLRHKVQLQEIAKKQQEELLEMKLRFFTNITHEFRTPLTLILGPLQQLVRQKDHPKETGRQLTMIERNAQRLLDLVNQVLTFRKLVTDHEPMEVSRLKVLPFLTDIFDSFQERARRRNIEYVIGSKAGNPELYLDPVKMEKVFYNLLSNAFKFTPDGGKIELLVDQTDERVLIHIKDNGRGIDPEAREKIFERFYEESAGKQSTVKSSGIGLSISRQMVALHQGDIYVADGVGVGAEFVVALRKGEAHFAGLDVSGGFLMGEDDKTVVPFEAGTTSPKEAKREARERATLLIVDDNADIRDYVESIFTDAYRVVTVVSGLDGLKAAKKESPELIISDVMMPEMDGLAFCQAVKTDLNISHIPVILLTARTAQPFRIEGLQTGADDYLTKPFHPEELRLRVANLLANRRRFKESFAATLNLDPSHIEVPSLDEQFLRDALEIAERHVQHPDYKVEDFARDLAVSRTLLFNKLKALTGQTPGKFIKSFRLKRAAQLLRDSDYPINKIADLTGFRSERYFSDSFKQQFGVTPGAYRKEG